MNNVISNIAREVEKFNDSIRKDLDSKNINNTTEASNSLRVEYGEDFVRSIGIFYLEFLDRGRYPVGYGIGGKKKTGSQSSGKKSNFYNAISKWAAQKLGITDEKENKKATFAIMNKINKVGTEIYINKKKGIEIDNKIEALTIAVNEAIRQTAKVEVKRLLDEFKKKYESQKFKI